jgi:hypothetical protein
MLMTTHLIGFGAGGGLGPVETIDRTLGTNIGDMTASGGLAAAFDGTTSQSGAVAAAKASTLNAFVGKTLAKKYAFSSATVYGSSNQGFWSSDNPSTTLDIYGKVGSAPASSTDGTIVGTTTFTDTANESAGRSVTSTDTNTLWDHLWVRISKASGATQCNCAELVLNGFPEL